MNKNVKTALIIGGIIVAILITLSSVFGPIWEWQGAGPGGILMTGGFSWWWFSIFMILFCGLIIWSIVALVRDPSGSRGSNSSIADPALEVLKRRHARSEINKEEYEEKKQGIA